MKMLLENNLGPEHVGKANDVDPRVLNLMRKVFERSEVLEESEEYVTCNIDGQAVSCDILHFKHMVAFPELARHQFAKHGVWSNEHHRFAKVMANVVARIKKSKIQKAEAPAVDWDSIDFEKAGTEAVTEPAKTEKNPAPKRRRSNRERAQSAHRARGRRGSSRHSRSTPPPTHMQPPMGTAQVPPWQNPNQPYQPPAAGGGYAEPQQPPGLFQSITSAFSGLFGGGNPQQPNGYDHNGYTGQQSHPALPGPTQQSPISAWYPDPGLRAQLSSSDGQPFTEGPVPAGRYQVEIHNGQSFVPLAAVDVHPGQSYRLYMQDGRVRWSVL